jgi:hypothetical protein
MRLVVLAVPDCPSARLLDQRLTRALEGRRDITISRHVVTDQDQAARLGMRGSPTVLVDGIDPFGGPGQQASVSCRLYRHRSGRSDGAPSVSELRQAVTNPAGIMPGTDTDGARWLAALGSGRSGRIAPAARGLRAVHQQVLRSFAATGSPPPGDVLDEAARPFDTAQVLAELAEGDYLGLDSDGRITAAYPFSATATPHTVRINAGAVAYSMCAVDALGTADMLDARVLIASSDPSTGEPISVAVDESGAVWEPDTAVVFAGHAARACAGPSAQTCCGHMNFFTSHVTAAAWASSRPDVVGGILSQGRALEIGRQIFGQLLR